MTALLLALQLGLLALGLAGCGAETLSVDPVAQAATRTTDAGSSRVTFSARIQSGADTMGMSGKGAFDYRSGHGSLTYRMSGPGLGAMRMELRAVGSRVYVRMPKELGAAVLPGGKEWLVVDVGASAPGVAGLNFTQSQDPSQTLRYLRSASDDVRESGSALVRGVRTTRYTGTLDFEQALDAGLERLAPSEQELTRKSIETLLEQLESSTMPFDVYVDATGLLRRLTMELVLNAGGESVSMLMSMDLFDFGIKVNVHEPPPHAVLDVGAAGLGVGG